MVGEVTLALCKRALWLHHLFCLHLLTLVRHGVSSSEVFAMMAEVDNTKWDKYLFFCSLTVVFLNAECMPHLILPAWNALNEIIGYTKIPHESMFVFSELTSLNYSIRMSSPVHLALCEQVVLL